MIVISSFYQISNDRLNWFCSSVQTKLLLEMSVTAPPLKYMCSTRRTKGADGKQIGSEQAVEHNSHHCDFYSLCYASAHWFLLWDVLYAMFLLFNCLMHWQSFIVTCMKSYLNWWRHSFSCWFVIGIAKFQSPFWYIYILYIMKGTTNLTSYMCHEPSFTAVRKTIHSVVVISCSVAVFIV